MDKGELEVFSNILKNLVEDKKGTIFIEKKVKNVKEITKKVKSKRYEFDLKDIVNNDSPTLNLLEKEEEVVIKDGEDWGIYRVATTQIHNLSNKTNIFTDEDDIYFTPHLYDWKQRNSANAWYLTCLFADLDGVSIEEAEERLKQSNLPQPSLKIFSGHGVHFYWKLSKIVSKNKFSTTWLKAQDYISTKLSSDKAVNDLARLMRVPLSFNNKKDRVKTEILYKNFDNTIDLTDFYNMYLKKEKKVIKKNNKTSKNKSKASKTKRINHYSKYIKEDIDKIIKERIKKDYKWEGMRNTVLVILKAMNFSENYINELNNNVFNLSQNEVEKILNWETSNRYMKRSNIYTKLDISVDEELEYGLRVLRNEDEVFVKNELKLLDAEIKRVFKQLSNYLKINYCKTSKKKVKDIAKDLKISSRSVNILKNKESADKNEMFNKLVDIATTSLSLAEFIQKDDCVLSKEMEDKLDKTLVIIKRLESLINDSSELTAENKFKVVVLKKKYNDLLNLQKIA